MSDGRRKLKVVHGLTVKAVDSSRRQVSIPTKYFVELSKPTRSKTPRLFGKELSRNPGPGNYEKSLDAITPQDRRAKKATFFLRRDKRFATSPQNRLLGPGTYEPVQRSPAKLGSILGEHRHALPRRLG